MGNYASCGLNGAADWRFPKAAAVIFPGGEVRRLVSPATAAELMMDAPGHFLVCAREMELGRRLLPLAADEELAAGEVYVMLPMKRVNAVATATDMAAAAAAEAPPQPLNSQTKVSPETAEEEEAAPPAAFMRRLSVCRSRKPSLETIAEETTR